MGGGGKVARRGTGTELMPLSSPQKDTNDMNGIIHKAPTLPLLDTK